jgi:hypothetical protein
MTKQPTAKPPAKAQMHSWDVYRIKGTPAALIGIVEAPPAEAAIANAIDEFKITGEARKRLIAQRR